LRTKADDESAESDWHRPSASPLNHSSSSRYLGRLGASGTQMSR
jgi:hypothetical protein